ncbi:MAG TPA: hypothetical protein PLZ55_19165, partial [bacterium]|nr:hypothetical protein [bacterium]
MKRIDVFIMLFVFAGVGIALSASAQGLELPLRGSSGEIIIGMGTLTGAAYSPDGQTIATCGALGVFIWDIETAQPIRW